MPISRRNLLRCAAAGALSARTTPLLGEFSRIPTTLQSSLTPSRGPTRLDHNENAYGPSDKTIEAIRVGAGAVNRYPDGDYEVLTEKLASLHKVKPEYILLGAGSREILRMAATTYLSRGKRLVLAAPTYGAIADYAKSVDAEVSAVPLNKRYQHDLDGMLARVQNTATLIYVCNPNNPTGTLTPRKDLEVFLTKLPPTTVVLIDEAYHHYVEPTSDYASFLDSPVEDPRVVVLRTFSKIYGLAGLRVGYAIGSPQALAKISAARLKWGVNVLAARAAAAALDDSDYVTLSFKRNTDDRQEFYNNANGRMLRSLDSHANFVFLKSGLPAEQVLEHFRTNHVLLGPRFPEMDTYVRVSLGRREEMHEFWRVWNSLPPHPMAM
jgi:histidinol-phosphate aminotransferase